MKVFKFFVYFLAIFILCRATFAQSNCEYWENEVDDMTNDTIVSTFAKIGQTPAAGLVFTFRKYNQHYFIRMGYGLYGIHSLLISSDAELLIKLNNDSLITLKTIDSYLGDFVGNETKLIAFYPITLKEIKAIQRNRIIKVRFYLSDSYAEIEAFTKSKKVAKIQKAIDCFMDNPYVRY